MIATAPELPSILGTGVPKINNADMKSYGFELEIGWRDRIKNFSYGVKFVLSDAQQKILKYNNPDKEEPDLFYSSRQPDSSRYQRCTG